MHTHRSQICFSREKKLAPIAAEWNNSRYQRLKLVFTFKVVVYFSSAIVLLAKFYESENTTHNSQEYSELKLKEKNKIIFIRFSLQIEKRFNKLSMRINFPEIRANSIFNSSFFNL